MVAPAVQGIDLFKIAGRSISGWIPIKTGAAFHVREIIYQELVREIITTEAKRRFQEIMAGLISRGAEGIILGRTEFMLLVRPDDVPVPTFDTTTLHALAAVSWA
jgi:aspartate/glutamate racemase